MEYKLIHEEVLVRVLKDAPLTPSGLLYIPKGARQALQLGEVVQNNTSLPLKPGDVVAFTNYRGRPLQDDLWILEKDDVECQVLR